MSGTLVIIITSTTPGIWTPPAGFNLNNWKMEAIGGGQAGMTPNYSTPLAGSNVYGGQGGMSGWYCCTGTAYGAAPLVNGASYSYQVGAGMAPVVGCAYDGSTAWWSAAGNPTWLKNPDSSYQILAPGGWTQSAYAPAIGSGTGGAYLNAAYTQNYACGATAIPLFGYNPNGGFGGNGLWAEGMSGGFVNSGTTGSSGSGGGGATGFYGPGSKLIALWYGGIGGDSDTSNVWGGGGGAGLGINGGSETTVTRCGGFNGPYPFPYSGAVTASTGGGGGTGGQSSSANATAGLPGTGWSDGVQNVGAGGGGGAGWATATAAGNGADGGLYGGGGGGGGRAGNGTFGTGGRGAQGVLVITSFGAITRSYIQVVRAR